MVNEKRLIDANALDNKLETLKIRFKALGRDNVVDDYNFVQTVLLTAPTVDAVEVVHGRWELTAHEEHSNFRWNVTAECSECLHNKGEIYAGFFPGFPKDLARDVVLDCAKSVKLDNYCPNCGSKMDGDGNV